MKFNITRPLTVSAILLLASCSFVDDKLLPPLTGDETPATSATGVAIAPSDAEGNPDPTLTTTAAAPAMAEKASRFQLPAITSAPSTGTVVGERVEGLRGELAGLQQRINQHSAQFEELQAATAANSQQYHGTMAAINARLQIGTTKGNPILINQWNDAQKGLEKIADDVSQMNGLANNVSADANEAGYLLDSTKSTFELSGAIEEDHRQLTVLEDEASRTSVIANRLLSQLSGDITRQTSYVGAERANLTNLSDAIKNGGFLGSAGSRNYLKTSSVSDPVTGGSNALVIIRFDREDVAYEQALYEAVSQTMQQRPQSSFDVVSISPLQGDVAANQAQSARNAEKVLRSLTNMGLPASRVNLSATSNTQVAANEVHIFVR
ncbi:MAG: hypothetical protein V7740_17995 [Pseudomonas marincola]